MTNSIAIKICRVHMSLPLFWVRRRREEATTKLTNTTLL
jgi:hypothetical protein